MNEIIRLSTGQVNNVNEASIGMATAPAFGPSPFAGQLGKRFYGVVGENLASNTTNGNIFNGWFRYVRLAAAAAVPVVGQILYWDVSVEDTLYQVTTAESGSTDAAMFVAGICLTPNLTVGNYTVIQDWGDVPVKFRGTLTAAGAAGSRVFCAASGGADLGFADVIDTGATPEFSDVSKMFGRQIGIARSAPMNGSLTRVYLSLPRNYHG